MTTLLPLALLLGLAQPEPPADLAKKVDAIFEDLDSTRSPGCAVALMREGEIVYANGYGMANLDHGVPIEAHSVFHVASVSKQFTAAAIVLLAQDGKLSFDDDVRRYVPELPDFGPRITIRHLLHHVSGVRDQWQLLGLAGWRYSKDRITDDDVLWILERQHELNFAPGEQYLYSNSGYTLLAQIVARVSGKSLREFTRERIFEPLGMTRTFFRDDFDEIVPDQAYGYERREDDSRAFRLSVTNFDTVGATSLLTTVEDMARWDRNFIDPRVGGEAFVRQMLSRFRLTGGEEIDYAFGLGVGEYRGLATVGHDGADAGYRANFVRFPEQGVSVVCLCNVPADPERRAHEVAELVLGDQMAAPEPAAEAAAEGVHVAAAVLAAKEGWYWNPEDDGFLHFLVADGGLRVAAGGSSWALVPLSEDRFQLKVFGVDFTFASAEGEPPHPAYLTEVQRSGKPEKRERIEPVVLTPDELAAFAGSYASDELGTSYSLHVEEGALVLRRIKADPEPLQQTLQDGFVGEIGTLRFTRQPDGSLSGFLLAAGRVRNLRFTRP